MPKCLKCEKNLKFVDCGNGGSNERNTTPIDDAGFIDVKFHYGSRHDQCHGFSGRKARLLSKRRAETTDDNPLKSDARPTPLDRMLASDLIQGYICDGCFENNLHLFEGWDKYEDVKYDRRV